jgi:hypothetical protein
MEAAELIIVAGAGIAAAALGYLAGLLLQRYRDWQAPRYWWAAGFAVAGVLIALAVLNGWLTSMTAITAERVAVDAVLPYMKAIKIKEPTLYERIETSVIRDQNDGLDPDHVRANAKAFVQSYVADKTIYLPDQLAYDLLATTRDELAYLAEHREYQACADLALGRANGDIDAKLNPDLVDRANDITTRVIAAQSKEEAVRMPAEEFSQFASRAFADASQATGVRPDEIDGLLAGTGDPAKTCKLMKAFFDSVLSQPVPVAASASRALAAGEKGTTH